MATANFPARIERINQMHRGGRAQMQAIPMQAYRPDGTRSAVIHPKRRGISPTVFIVPVVFGLFLGFVAGMMLTGVTTEGSPIGPGTPLNATMFLTGLIGLGLAPIFMLAALYLQGRKPRFAVFALAYLTGLIVTLVI